MRQQNTTPSWVFAANANLNDINPAQAEDLTDPHSVTSGIRLVLFNNKVYLWTGRRDRLEINLPSNIGKIKPGDNNPMSIVEAAKGYGQGLEDLASGKGAKEFTPFMRVRGNRMAELGYGLDAVKLTLPDGTIYNVNTYNELQWYPFDGRAGVKRNGEKGRSWEGVLGMESFPKILADSAAQATYVDPRWRIVPNLGQSAGRFWEHHELEPASANRGAPTIGPLMPIEAGRSLDAAALIQNGVKQVAWRDLPGQAGTGWKIADHEGRRYLKAVDDAFDVTGYDDMILSRFEHQPAAGINPAKLSLSQIELNSLSAVKPELSSTNRVSLANGNGVLAQANGHTYVVVDQKDVFDVTGLRPTDLQSLRFMPADQARGARLSPIGTFTLSPIPLDSATAQAAAQSTSRQSLPGGGEAVFVTLGNRELVLYRRSAGVQSELYDWTGYGRRTIEEWLQTR